MKEFSDMIAYLAHPEELFARSYSQYIGDAALINLIDAALADDSPLVSHLQWPYMRISCR